MSYVAVRLPNTDIMFCYGMNKEPYIHIWYSPQHCMYNILKTFKSASFIPSLPTLILTPILTCNVDGM